MKKFKLRQLEVEAALWDGTQEFYDTLFDGRVYPEKGDWIVRSRNGQVGAVLNDEDFKFFFEENN